MTHILRLLALLLLALPCSPQRSNFTCMPVQVTGGAPFLLSCRLGVPPSVTAIYNLEVVLWDAQGHLRAACWVPGVIYPATPWVAFVAYYQPGTHPHALHETWTVRARWQDQNGAGWRSTVEQIVID
jgi:hypothetical protein